MCEIEESSVHSGETFVILTIFAIRQVLLPLYAAAAAGGTTQRKKETQQRLLFKLVILVGVVIEVALNVDDGGALITGAGGQVAQGADQVSQLSWSCTQSSLLV